MKKITVEFDIKDREDEEEAKLAINAKNLQNACFEIAMEIRNWDKYREFHTEEAQEVVSEIREKIHEIFADNEVNI